MVINKFKFPLTCKNKLEILDIEEAKLLSGQINAGPFFMMKWYKVFFNNNYNLYLLAQPCGLIHSLSTR